MQFRQMAVLLLLAAAALPSQSAATADATDPLNKVIELINSLAAKVGKAGEAEAKAFEAYMEWCDDETKNKQFEIKTATTMKEKLEAAIAKAAACIESSGVNIENLAASIATATAELKNATLIREKENGDFVAAETELVDTVDTLDRAINIIQREMAKNPALMQVDTSSLMKLVKSMEAVVNAAALPGTDRKKLLALVQSRQEGDDEEAEADEEKLGAPAPAAYKSHSTNIVDVLTDLKDKAEAELADLRRAEVATQHNYDMLKQSLMDQIKADEKEMAEEKANKVGCEEDKATAEGDLAVTVKELADAEAALKFAQDSCMQVAADHDTSIASRAAEMKALAAAKKILESTSAGAVSQAYSLLQVASGSRMQTHSDLVGAEVVTLLKHLAKQQRSIAMSQLASKISAVLRYRTAGGDDVFAKVKGLINDMIEKLMAQAAAEATEKAYCDETMAKTEEKKGELEDDVAKLTSKIDKGTAQSATLKEEVRVLQEELAALARQQAEMDEARQKESAAFLEAKTDLELGINGVQGALKVLREYYNGAEGAFMQQPAVPVYHEKAVGAGGGIISILEVCESDFSKDLAEKTTAEEDAQANYDKMTQENKVTKTMKDQDVKYKTQEIEGLAKSLSQWSADRDTANTELAAVLDFYEKLKDRCIAKPETYEERKRRREAELAGLKEALQILESETAFVQRGATKNLLQR